MAVAPIPTPSSDPAVDPSMDDILASIRRILNDDEKTKAAEPVEDVLMLDPSMMLPDPAPTPAALAAVPAAAPAFAKEIVPMPESLPSSYTAPPPPPAKSEPLVAPAAAAAAATSVGALMRTLATERTTAVHRNGPTLEDLVREEMRPLLKQWLDEHLPPLVERLVRAEIERVVGRMAS